MPSAYAHRVFGEEVRKKIPKDLNHVIDQYSDLFYIGLHGPDILFYYRPLFPGKVKSIGHVMHRRAASRFFRSAAEFISYGGEDGKMGFSYVMGFICHFALDSQFHPVVNRIMKETGVGHMEIEAELDKLLVRSDGLDPFDIDYTEHIHPSDETNAAIAKFFEIKPRHVDKTLRGMKFYCNLFATRNKKVRFVLQPYIKRNGLFLRETDNEKCAEGVLRLKEMLPEAEDLAVALIENYWEWIKGHAALSKRFERRFD